MTNTETDAPPAPVIAKGLENVVALESQLSYVDGQAGNLAYRGYQIHDLAGNVGFEETAFLLWRGHLPNRKELAETTRSLQEERNVPDEIIDLLKSLPGDAEPMSVLRTGASALALFDPEAKDQSTEANHRKAIRLTAKLPTILAAYDRIRKGLDWVPPRRQGSIAEEFLYMLNGEQPGEMATKTFDLCLVLHADHGLNASTFTARVVGSTLSDMYSGVVAAIGALKGPLHGGANIEVMNSLLEIRRDNLDAAKFIRDKLARKERIMGFGHRVYRTMDPRATSLRGMLTRLSEEKGDTYWLDTAVAMMNTMRAEKGLNPNVDFFSAPVYYLLGIEIDLFTPIFAISRVVGWTAHLLEQWDGNRLIRPRLAYVGNRNLTVVPVDER